MATLKTAPHDGSVEQFIRAVEDPDRRRDCRGILAIMKRVTGEKPVMWGPSIIGFGSYRYRYASGREGDWFVTGFSPRKRDLTLYIMSGFSRHDALLKKLGKHRTGKACLYVKRLPDVDLEVLEELVRASVAHLEKSRAAQG